MTEREDIFKKGINKTSHEGRRNKMTGRELKEYRVSKGKEAK